VKLHRHLFPFLLMLSLLLGACSPQESTKPAASAKREVSLVAVAAEAKGFAVGSLMSANTVYVFFDSQCPHCGHLWQAAEPLHSKIKFVWIPVGMINATSAAQGAALLTAANPGALMAEHEASFLAGKGGISASSSVPTEIEQAIKNNTRILNSFGAEAVPFMVAKNLKTGLTVSRDGALSTAALAEFLGLDLP
jgi:thiol:disulfide interchange protein DsbG